MRVPVLARKCSLSWPGIDAREEILAETGQRAHGKCQERGRGHGEQEDGGEQQAAVDRQAEQIPVDVPHALEAVLEPCLKARQDGRFCPE